MRVVKVRRVGNSNVVSIPRELEARGYAPGTSVLLEELESGELRIIPTYQVRERIRGIGRPGNAGVESRYDFRARLVHQSSDFGCGVRQSPELLLPSPQAQHG